MCPISGMVQFLIVIVTLLLVCHVAFVTAFKISFKPNRLNVSISDSQEVKYEVTELGNLTDDANLILYSENTHIAYLPRDIVISNPEKNLSGVFNVTGNFLGKTKISCKNNKTGEVGEGSVDVVIVRKMRLIDVIFHVTVVTLVSVLLINFGCALDWEHFPSMLRKPQAPVIGFLAQAIGMPLLGFVIGKVIFPNSPEMQLGLFFTGMVPAGEASNIWTVLLEGNLNLSITVTALSTISGFFLIPFWTFTLGATIFENAKLEVPYKLLSSYVAALVVPLLIGFLIQRYLKRVARFMTRILKAFSACLILFIIVFAIITNLYLFQLFSWQIIVSGMALPWLGYATGYILAKLARLSAPDCLTLGIEVGIQNTGIAIYLLKFALPQPEADLTTVVPVATAIMSPLPLLLLFACKKIHARFFKIQEGDSLPNSLDPKIENNSNGNCPEERHILVK